MFFNFQGSPVLGRYLCVVYYTFLCITVSVFVLFVSSAQGSMRKANSLSQCRLLRVRRSGRRRRSLGKRAVSSGRWRVISDRRARMRPSCNCSTAHMSEMPEWSEGHSGCQCEWFTDTVTSSSTKCNCSAAFFHQIMHSFSPAETNTTAIKRAISSGSRPKEPNFSLNSNIASSREPMPKARRVGRG